MWGVLGYPWEFLELASFPHLYEVRRCMNSFNSESMLILWDLIEKLGLITGTKAKSLNRQIDGEDLERRIWKDLERQVENPNPPNLMPNPRLLTAKCIQNWPMTWEMHWMSESELSFWTEVGGSTLAPWPMASHMFRVLNRFDHGVLTIHLAFPGARHSNSLLSRIRVHLQAGGQDKMDKQSNTDVHGPSLN